MEQVNLHPILLAVFRMETQLHCNRFILLSLLLSMCLCLLLAMCCGPYFNFGIVLVGISLFFDVLICFICTSHCTHLHQLIRVDALLYHRIPRLIWLAKILRDHLIIRHIFFKLVDGLSLKRIQVWLGFCLNMLIFLVDLHLGLSLSLTIVFSLSLDILKGMYDRLEP